MRSSRRHGDGRFGNNLKYDILNFDSPYYYLSGRFSDAKAGNYLVSYLVGALSPVNHNAIRLK